MSVEYNVGYGLQFVDTNILVYAHDNSAGVKRELAKALMVDLWRSESGCISVQVLQEFFVTITRKVPQPVSIPKAKELIQDLSLWQIHSPTQQDVVAAIDMQMKFQLSFWDAMIVNSANRMNCAVLWSEDLNAGQTYGAVQLKNPFA